MRRALAVLLVLLAAVPARAQTCEEAIHAAEAAVGIPGGLLLAIGRVEAGRLDPATGRVQIWPWTSNAAGKGAFYNDAGAAVQAVAALQSQGVRSIDVGCVQVNLLAHPAAFASLDQAMDPRTNTLYGARFLRTLFAQLGSWDLAVAAYHSRTPALGAAYEARVLGRAPAPAQVMQAAVAAGPYRAWPPAGTRYAAFAPVSFTFGAFARPGAR